MGRNASLQGKVFPLLGKAFRGGEAVARQRLQKRANQLFFNKLQTHCALQMASQLRRT